MPTRRELLKAGLAAAIVTIVPATAEAEADYPAPLPLEPSRDIEPFVFTDYPAMAVNGSVTVWNRHPTGELYVRLLMQGDDLKQRPTPGDRRLEPGDVMCLQLPASTPTRVIANGPGLAGVDIQLNKIVVLVPSTPITHESWDYRD